MTDPATEARRLYAPKIRYSEVLSLCELFGISNSVARSLMEGPEPKITGEAIGPFTRRGKSNSPRKYYNRETVIKAIS